MRSVKIREEAGIFAENKDIAGHLRDTVILPLLRDNQEIVIDFAGVEGATQSFIHALVSEAIREMGSDVLDHIIFKGCNETIQTVIGIVVDYMQESL